MEGGRLHGDSTAAIFDGAFTFGVKSRALLYISIHVSANHYEEAVELHAHHDNLGSMFCGKNGISVGATRSRTPAELQYEPRIDVLQHGYEYTHR